MWLLLTHRSYGVFSGSHHHRRDVQTVVARKAIISHEMLIGLKGPQPLWEKLAAPLGKRSSRFEEVPFKHYSISTTWYSKRG